MTRSLPEANDALFLIRRMPYGVARSTATAAELDRIRAEGPDAARAFALFCLVEAYVWGGEVGKAYLPFTQVLRWWDEHPEHFDLDDQHSMFWSFKWMVGHLKDFPTVPAEQIDRTIEDMRRRYALAGNGMNAVALSRFQWARMRGTDDTETAYQEWVATPRDDFSQCEACEPGDRAVYLFETGRHAEGIRLIESTLADSPSCATEPGDMLSCLQLAYLEVGDAEGASRAHRAAVQHLSGEVSMAGAKARHVEFLARTGNSSRALRLLEEYQDFLTEADTPYERWMFLCATAAATGILRGTVGERPLDLRAVPARTIAELDDWARAQALEIAAGFDARNGTTWTTRRTAAHWERLTTLPVELSVLATEPGAGRALVGTAGAPDATGAMAGTGAPGVPGPSGAPGAPGGDGLTGPGVGGAPADSPDALIALAEDVAPTDRPRAARLYMTAADLLEATGYLDQAGFARAEAAELAAREGDHDGAGAAFGRAQSLLWAAGVPPRFIGPVIRAWARRTPASGQLADVLVAHDRVLAALTAVNGPAVVPTALGDDELRAREDADRLTEVRRLRDSRARVRATLGDLAEAAAEAEAVAEEFARAGEVADAAYAFWLAGSVRVAEGTPGDSVDLLESAVEGFAMAHDHPARARVGNELVGVLQGLGRHDEAQQLATSLVG